MHASRRLGKMFLMMLAIGAVGAVGASSAMASVHWSDTTHGTKVSGSLTVTTAEKPAKTCTPSSSQESSMNTTAAWVWTSGSSGWLTFSCEGGGTLEVYTLLSATSTTSVTLSNIGAVEKAPWGMTYTQNQSPEGDFVNGSGSTPSTLTFGGLDQLGPYFPTGKPVFVSGTLKITTSTGGLLTLLP